VFAKKSRRGGVHRVAPMADGGGSGSREEKSGRLYTVCKAVEAMAWAPS
jgi:hypothetical protein